jgi:hypothetical protein
MPKTKEWMAEYVRESERGLIPIFGLPDLTCFSSTSKEQVIQEIADAAREIGIMFSFSPAKATRDSGVVLLKLVEKKFVYDDF